MRCRTVFKSRLKLTSTPRAQVAILAVNLRYWPELLELCDGLQVVVIETQRAPLRISRLRRILQLWRSDYTTLGFAAAAAELEASGAKVLVAIDQSFEAIHQLGQLLPVVPQVLVAHGSIRNENIKRAGIMHRDHRLLAVWGEQDVLAYSESCEVPVQCIPIGSLRNAVYLKSRTAPPTAESRHPLLFVSQYSGKRETLDEGNPDRLRTLNLTKRHLARYCRERSIPLRIALRPAVSGDLMPDLHEEEKQHYFQVFESVKISFSDPSVRYSTYWESDCADVTIGVPAGSLTESFARGNKVLMIRQNPISGSYYGFPLDGIWLLTEPTYQEFAQRLDTLREIDLETWANVSTDARCQMIQDGESDRAFWLIREIVLKFVSRSTT